MAILKSFENQFGVDVTYHKITQLTPIKAGGYAMTGDEDNDKERVGVLIASYVSQDAKEAGKAVFEHRNLTLVGSVDDGRKAIYEKIMELKDWEGAKAC